MPILAAFREIFFPGLGWNRFIGRLIGDLHAENVFDKARVVHADCVVVGEERANLDADVASDTFLIAVLHWLHAASGNRTGFQVLDTLNGAEFRALSAWEAQVHVHERDFARPLLLMSDFFGRLRDTIFLEATLDDFDGAHTAIVTRFAAARSSAGAYLIAKRLPYLIAQRSRYLIAKMRPFEFPTYSIPSGETAVVVIVPKLREVQR